MSKLFTDAVGPREPILSIPEGTYCHKLVAETAKNLAASMYQHMAERSNEFFKEVPSEEEFVKKIWPNLVEDARTTLVNMLSGPYPEELKDEISRAIILDNTLVRGRPERVASRLKTAQTPTALLRTASET